MTAPTVTAEDFPVLLQAARAGRPGAFATLYEDLARPVGAYLRSRGVRDVEDLTSDVFLAVFTGLGRFEGDYGRFRSWVFTIAHRRAVDEFRRSSRTPWTRTFEPEDDTRAVSSAEDAALGALREAEVLALLDRLTEDQRTVLVLRVVADLTVEQVAEVTGRRAGAVKALQRRGLASVRRMLDGGVPL